MPSPRPRSRLIALFAIVACAACSGDPAVTLAPPPSSPPAVNPRILPAYFPPTTGTTWDTVSAEALGYDTTALREALDWAGTQQSTAVIVLWRGRIVAERYWRGWTASKDSTIASAGKSVLSVVIGELARQGRVGMDSLASKYLGVGWSRSAVSESRITVRQLMGMMSGLDDSLKFVAQPGNRFYYNNPAYYQLFNIAQTASGQDLTTLSRTLLFNRIGMSGASWSPNVDVGEFGYSLRCNARDMARFGLLALHRGSWDGVRIVADSAWFAASWRAVPVDNGAYGLLWWLNGSASFRGPGPYLLPTQSGSLVPSAPSDMVAALGKGDKKIYVVPSLELVVVRHGAESDVAASANALAVSVFDEQWWQRLRRAFR